MADIILDQLGLKAGDIFKQSDVEKIDSNATKTQDAINLNFNKIGVLTTNGITEPDLATAIKNDRTQLSGIPNQTYITEKAKTIDVNNALALKADKTSLDSTNANVTNNTNSIATHTSQIASLSSGSPKGVYATLSALQTAYPTGNANTYIVNGDIKEVDTLTVTAIPTVAGNITITLNGVAFTVALTLAMTTTDLVATAIRGTTFSGWTTGGSGSNITFTKVTSGTNTSPIFSGGTTTSTATFTITTSGVNADYGWYYWSLSAWNRGNTYQSTSLADGAVTPVKTSFFVLNAINLLDPTKFVAGTSVNSVNGAVVNDANYCASGWRIISPSTSYCGYKTKFYAFFDSAFAYISGGATLDSYVTSPSNATYMRVAFLTADTNKAILVQGTSCPEKIVYKFQIETEVNENIIKMQSDIIGLKGKWYGKNALCIGDSLTAAGVWQQKLNTILGMTVTTHALGGLGLIEMVDGGTNSNGTLAPLTSSDVANKDLIIVYGGYNNRGTADGIIGDIYPTNNTIAGLLQYVVNKIYSLLTTANNLKCRIAIVTPHCAGKYQFIDADGYTEYAPGTGRTMKTLAKKIEEIANLNSLPCYNAWENSGINKFTWNVFSASPNAYDASGSQGGTYPNNYDQLHLNSSVGYPHLGERITSFIETI